MICRDVQRVITLKTCFWERARQTALNKCLLCDRGYVICPLLAGGRSSLSGRQIYATRTQGQKESQRSISSEMDEHAPPRLTSPSASAFLLPLFLQGSLSALFTQGCEDHLIMAPGYLSLLPFQPSESYHHCAECLDRRVIRGGMSGLKQNDTTVIAPPLNTNCLPSISRADGDSAQGKQERSKWQLVVFFFSTRKMMKMSVSERQK